MMRWLTHNPIADMPGPQFLVLYAVVLMITIVIVRLRVRRLDPTLGHEPPTVPGKLNAHEIAYLRGDAPRVLAVVVYDLCRRGYLQVLKPEVALKGPLLAWASEVPDPRQLLDFEMAVFQTLKQPRAIADMRTDRALTGMTAEYCENLKEPLEDDLMLMPEGCRSAAREFSMAAAACLCLFACYKLFIALDKGRHNVGFLVVMAILGAIAVLAAGHLSRLTRLGKAYLERLKTTFADWPSLASRPDSTKSPAAVMAIALLGLPALAGTSLESTWKPLMPHAEAGGCGCAAGGGGCGGGGCGGCGG